MKIKFWGTRGSIPVPGRNTLKYGGNTPCVQITSNSGNSIILDAGTGINNLGNKILNENKGKEIEILITHSHWDHIQGLIFFQPLYKENYKVNIHAGTNNNLPVEKILDAQFNTSFFPVGKEVLNAQIKLEHLKPQNSLEINEFRIETIETHHSKGTLGFKVITDNKSIVYLTDNEIYCNFNKIPDLNILRNKNEELINFCSEADFLIHDSMFDFNDYKSKSGWGHSNNHTATAFAITANVKNIILFHYNPLYTDLQIDRLVKESRELIEQYGLSLKCIPSDELNIIEF